MPLPGTVRKHDLLCKSIGGFMKQEKWITVILCAVIILGAGIFYLRSDNTAQEQKMGFAPGSTVVENADRSSFDSESITKESIHEAQQGEKESGQAEYAVYICGAVKHPGVYQFAYMARVCDVIEAAGGLKKNAAAASVNQARYIVDGEQIQILTRKQAKAERLQMDNEAPAGSQDGGAVSSALVNINQAAETELMTLPGIGQSKAKAIIDYRTQNGSFGSTEDIMKVSGIKEGVYEQIKDSITV